MEAPTANNTKKIIATIVILLVAVLAVVGVRAFSDGSGTAKTDATTSNSNQSSPSSSTGQTTGSYKDGEYSASGEYDTPRSTETIDVKVTIKDNVITDVSATTDPTERESREWQSRFLSGYKQLVVGKPVNEVKLSRVSGSSLTPQGFNNALDTIKDQAKV